MNKKQIFAEKLKHALLANGLEPKAVVLEREFNLRYYGKPLGQHAVAKWLRAETIPSKDKLKLLIDWLGLDLSDIFDEATLNSLNQPAKAPKLDFEKSSMSYKDKVLLKIFYELPNDQRKLVRDLVLTLYKANNQD